MESFMSLRREKKNYTNAHIAQLSCTLVCLEPTALFWDNIRGFKPEYVALRRRIADFKTVSFSFRGVFPSPHIPHVLVPAVAVVVV